MLLVGSFGVYLSSWPFVRKATDGSPSSFRSPTTATSGHGSVIDSLTHLPSGSTPTHLLVYSPNTHFTHWHHTCPTQSIGVIHIFGALLVAQPCHLLTTRMLLPHVQFSATSLRPGRQSFSFSTISVKSVNLYRRAYAGCTSLHILDTLSLYVIFSRAVAGCFTLSTGTPLHLPTGRSNASLIFFRAISPSSWDAVVVAL